MKTLHHILVLALVAAGVASTGARAQPAARDDVRLILVEWFECDECEEKQLERVVALGRSVVPSLAATLREGLSPANAAAMERELSRRWDELREEGRRQGKVVLASSRKEFVAMYLANYDAQYRVRAAEALGRIGGDEAKKALRDAIRSAPREDVRVAIERALGGGR